MREASSKHEDVLASRKAVDVEVRRLQQQAETERRVEVLGDRLSREQAQQRPKELEPFLTDDFTADLWSMVEDELLLVLPPFPLHERDECPAREDLEAFEPDGSEAEPVRKSGENPFSVLAELKKTKH